MDPGASRCFDLRQGRHGYPFTLHSPHALTLEFLEDSPAVRNTVLYIHKLPTYVGDPTAAAAFRLLFRSIKKLLITSHVIGELGLL
jgi:hypothetical protein